MRAAVNRKYGKSDVVNIEEAEKPEITNDEILVKVKFSSVNRTYQGFLNGKPRIVR